MVVFYTSELYLGHCLIQVEKHHIMGTLHIDGTHTKSASYVNPETLGPAINDRRVRYGIWRHHMKVVW